MIEQGDQPTIAALREVIWQIIVDDETRLRYEDELAHALKQLKPLMAPVQAMRIESCTSCGSQIGYTAHDGCCYCVVCVPSYHWSAGTSKEIQSLVREIPHWIMIHDCVMHDIPLPAQNVLHPYPDGNDRLQMRTKMGVGNDPDTDVCAYEHCQKPIEAVPGHRRKEYCNDVCRQAAHRLRKEREKREKQEDLSYYLNKYHTPQLHTILEQTLQEQGSAALLRLALAIDEERRHAQTNDEMQQRVAYLEIKVSKYRSIIDLEDRTKIEQQFMAIGQLLDYQALDSFISARGAPAGKITALGQMN